MWNIVVFLASKDVNSSIRALVYLQQKSTSNAFVLDQKMPLREPLRKCRSKTKKGQTMKLKFSTFFLKLYLQNQFNNCFFVAYSNLYWLKCTIFKNDLSVYLFFCFCPKIVDFVD